LSGQDTKKPLPYDPSKPLDSYILHSPLNTVAETLEAWHVLMSLQDEGKVGMIGVSNAYRVRVLEHMAKERRVQVVQNRWYEGNEWDKDVVKFCRDNGVTYQSFWTLTGSPNLCRHPAVEQLSRATDRTPAQIIYRVAQLHGITPLAGSKNEGRMKDGVDVETIEFGDTSLQGALQSLEELVFSR